MMILRGNKSSKSKNEGSYGAAWLKLVGEEEFISREVWAMMLGVNRNTLRRWEDEVIKKKIPLKLYFYKRKGRYGYDAYQRFITLLIYILKNQVDRLRPLTNSEIVDFFGTQHDGVSMWKIFSRDNFAEYKKVYNA